MTENLITWHWVDQANLRDLVRRKVRQGFECNYAEIVIATGDVSKSCNQVVNIEFLSV